MVAGPFVGRCDIGQLAGIEQARQAGDAVAVQGLAQAGNVAQKASRSRMCRRRGTASTAKIAASPSSGTP